ncbi:hypothetical protein CEXT_262581 [Caerostris extrusa]|uniref:Uncharacterized protein n=1 Tax=Caerostris extrusa TaxID=172846 RepID=A0AAV4R2H5_CAEEX|nr:hypothetical protein CEXT_262581 [Caerostris extrusa]
MEAYKLSYEALALNGINFRLSFHQAAASSRAKGKRLSLILQEEMPSFYARRGVCVLSVSRFITHLALSCGRGSDKSCSQQKDKKRIYRFQKGLR